MFYTGIGSRETPLEVQVFMKKTASYLATKNYILRSGGANGADICFEIGCDKANGLKEIYLPWGNFNNSESDLVVENERAFEIAEKYHPYWHNLKDGARRLQARNSHQILGKDLETPSSFVLCYTKGGKMIGGTAQALRIAKDCNIPIFNFGDYNNSNYDKCLKDLRQFLNDIIH